MLIEYYIVNLHFTKCVYKYLKIIIVLELYNFIFFHTYFNSIYYKNKIRLKKCFIKKLTKNMKYIKILLKIILFSSIQYRLK